MKARLKRLIDKILLRDVTYEMREELARLRRDTAQVTRSLRTLETDVRRMNSNLALLMQDVTAGQEALADQILDARRDSHLALAGISRQLEALAPQIPPTGTEDPAKTRAN